MWIGGTEAHLAIGLTARVSKGLQVEISLWLEYWMYRENVQSSETHGLIARFILHKTYLAETCRHFIKSFVFS